MTFSHLLTELTVHEVMLTNSSIATVDCRVDVRKCFFAERVLKPWNSLPAELHHFSSLSVFKRFIFSVDLSEFVTC